MKKVAIIGAGPAGLFAAYALAGKADVTVFDKGKKVEQRVCPEPDNCTRKCRLCSKIYGQGGAGLMSDGKLIFHTFVGNRLYDFIPDKKNKQLVDKVKNIFANYNVKPKMLTRSDLYGIKKIEEAAAKAGTKFVATKEVAHVGTDKLPDLIQKFRDNIQAKGAKFVNNINVKNIRKDTGFYIETDKGSYNFDYVFVAPGRVGAGWLEQLAIEHSIDFVYSPMDLGVRVETKRYITDPITDLVRDMKFYIETPNGDIVRTFCTCPGGKVVRETHEAGFNLVNGQSEKGDLGENTNFALLVSIPFKDPQANGNLIARDIATLIKDCGCDKPLLQRLGELKQTRRSKKKHLWKFDPKPSLEDVTVGDNGFLPYRIVKDLLYAFEKLDKIMPGIDNDNTLIYSPEAKFQSIKIKTDQYLQTNIDGLYVGGDGAGLSSGIVGAACCGLLAAEGILNSP